MLEWTSNDPKITELALLQADNENMLAAELRQKLPGSGAITLSGYADGIYYFRVEESGITSKVIQVEVKHHSLEKAFAFFFAGLILFCVLALSIFLGNKSQKGSKA